MTFLNQSLAYGAAAFLIPLVIHIINRSRFRTVEWGAMHLLESVLQVNQKRFHIEQLILLMIRCAIPILLALSLARPVLTGARQLERDAPVSLVVLLDNSYSMDALGPSGARFASAVDAASAIVSETSRGSQICVIRTGGRPTPLFDQPVFESEAVVRRMKQLRAGFGASDMPAAIDMALSTLAGMSHPRRELLVISDFQSADWDNVRADNAASFRQQIEAMEIKPAMTLMPVGAPVTGNVSVDSLSLPRRALGVGQQLSVRAELRNHSESTSDNVRAMLNIDGAEHSVTQITLEPNSRRQLLFPCTLESPGSHVLEVEIVSDDPLATDNRFAAALTVWDSIKVLLVDGDPSSQPLQSETDYLSVSLTPFTFGRLRLSDLVQTQTIAASGLKNELLATAKVVVLANVPRLSDSELTAITKYVQDGGALLVCAGNRIDLNWYRQKFFADGTGLLPMCFGAARGPTEESGTSARIVAQHFDHPALEFFNEAANGDLSTAEIRQWCEMTVRPTEGTPDMATSDESAAEASAAEAATTDQSADSRVPIVMARMNNGDPFLAEQQVGDGLVVQMATSCDTDWSDLPLRQVYVPLMQQLVTTMASRVSPPRNITTGDSAVAVFSSDESESVAATETAEPHGEDDTVADEIFSVTTPDGTRRTVRAMRQGHTTVARFDETQRPGVYAMTLPSTDTIHFAAETSRTESELNSLDEPQLTSLAADLQAEVVRSSTEYLMQDRLRRHGQEIWKYLLAALLAFLLLELMLQQRFARVRA